MRGLGLDQTTNQMRECDQFKPLPNSEVYIFSHISARLQVRFGSARGKWTAHSLCCFLDEGRKYSPHFQQCHTWPASKLRTAAWCTNTHEPKKNIDRTLVTLHLTLTTHGLSLMLLINTRNMRPRKICIKLHHCCNSCHETDDSWQNSCFILCWAIRLQSWHSTTVNISIDKYQ